MHGERKLEIKQFFYFKFDVYFSYNRIKYNINNKNDSIRNAEELSYFTSIAP